jgi:hypothetical protein
MNGKEQEEEEGGKAIRRKVLIALFCVLVRVKSTVACQIFARGGFPWAFAAKHLAVTVDYCIIKDSLTSHLKNYTLVC